MRSDVAVVVIGRNEGDRLGRCLRSVVGRTAALVYVDSGSTDGSADLARSLGADVVELDPARPFTAARGRNEGFARAVALVPSAAFVQFVDGDCELAPDWIDAAASHLAAHPDVAVAAGRLRERARDASPWNRLADLEWDVPPGDAESVGGNAMIRADAFRAAGGFAAEMIAGEEPDLCRRIRAHGGRIVRLRDEMGLHDASIHRFVQWWRRQERGGHSYAERVERELRAGDRGGLRTLASIALWGGALPALALAAAWSTRGASLLALGAYGLLLARLYRSRRARGASRGDAALYACATTVGKAAELVGVARFAANRWLLRRRTDLIEYKDAAGAARARGGRR